MPIPNANASEVQLRTKKIIEGESKRTEEKVTQLIEQVEDESVIKLIEVNVLNLRKQNRVGCQLLVYHNLDADAAAALEGIFKKLREIYLLGDRSGGCDEATGLCINFNHANDT